MKSSGKIFSCRFSSFLLCVFDDLTIAVAMINVASWIGFWFLIIVAGHALFINSHIGMNEPLLSFK